MSIDTHDCLCGMCHDCLDYQNKMWAGLSDEIRREEENLDQFVREFREAYEKGRAEEYDNRIDILVCYEQGVIETDTYEWESYEGKYADEKYLNLWDLKGPIGF